MRLAIAVLLLLFSRTVTFAQTSEDVVTSDVDWSAGKLTVTVERSVERIGARGPTAISQTQRSIRRDAPRILLEALSAVPYDSTHTVGSLIRDNERLIVALERAAALGTAVDAVASPDLQHAAVTFVVDLYRDLASQFVRHDQPVEIASELGWVAHSDYTGILIYAADELPLFGTDRTVALEPTLFPGVYFTDASGSLIFRLAEADAVDPLLLATEGPAAYTDDIQATEHGDRVGTRPLRILAVAAFGTRPTDVVISNEDARTIMASERNRALLREGRVVVVVDPEQL